MWVSERCDRLAGMRVVVLGGTKFIGRAITEALAARGDEVTVVHRGETEPRPWVDCHHVHTDRKDFAEVSAQIRSLHPEGVIDTLALTRADATSVLPHLPDTRLVLLSSVDVYRAFELVLADSEGEPLPISERSALRARRYPYRDQPGYDKLDVEPLFTERGATVLRLVMIYGEHDPQRREEFMLRRVRAGRRRIPVGPGTWLWTRCYAGDVASAALAAIDTPAAAGEILNVGEPATRSMLGWAREILAAAGHDAELVTVPGPAVPPDLWPTKDVGQHLLVDSRRAMDLLGWRPSDPDGALRRSVRWHLSHPPPGPDPGFGPDDQALAAADG